MSNHSGDANKMVREDVSNEQVAAEATPAGEIRRQILSHFVPKNEREWWAASAIERLELELNAANQRIKQLEDARTAVAANSLANMLAYEDAVAKIKRLEDACDEAISFFELLIPVAQTPNIPELIAKNLRKAKEAKP